MKSLLYIKIYTILTVEKINIFNIKEIFYDKKYAHRIRQALLCSAFLAAAPWGLKAIDFRSQVTDCSIKSHALPSAPVAEEATAAAPKMFEAHVTDPKEPALKPVLCVTYTLLNDEINITKLDFHEATKRQIPVMYTFLECYAALYKINAVLSPDFQDREVFPDVSFQKLLEKVGFDQQGDKLKLVRQVLPWIPQPK